MSKSIAKNLSYNVMLQIVLMIIPLISIPYVSRILGADGIGTYSFTLSITQYFIILGTLGIALYGNRQIAYVREDQEKLSKTFWSILILRVITTSIALVIYYVLFYNSDTYREIRIIQSFHIISAMIDITWLYIGLEDFKRIVTRNLLIKIGGLILIFVVIKDANDVYLYTLINVGMSFFSSLIMWLYVPQITKKVKITIDDLKEHFIPVLRLFVPQIASQVYVLLDKTMLGFLSTIDQVGFYTQAERIVKSVLEVISALGVVMLPRMSNIFAKGEVRKMNEYLNNSLVGVTYVALPMVIGIIAVSSEFVPWFFGPGYEEVILLMKLLSPILIFITLSSVLGVQYLLPSNRINEFTISIVIGAIVNLTINWLLIPRFDAVGAVIGTISAELIVMLTQAYFLRNTINVKLYFNSLLKYSIAVTFMFISVRFIGSYSGANVSTTLIQVFTGIVVYICILSLLKEETNLRVWGIVRTGIKKIIMKRRSV